MRLMSVGVLVVVFLLLAAVGAGTVVADVRLGGTVTVGEDETVGDLTVIGGTVTIDGTVAGDLTVFAGTSRINGDVEGDVSIVGGTLEVAGTVGGHVSAAAGSIVIAEDATVGSLSAGAGSVDLDGTVRGDITAGVGTITLGPTAHVQGDLTYGGGVRGGELRMHDDARVDGTITEEGFDAWSPVWPTVVVDWTGALALAMMHFVLGAVLLLLAPQFSADLAASVRETPARNGAIGLAILLGVPIVLLVLLLTIVGIPLALAGAVLFLVVYWIGLVYGRFAVGAWLLSFTEVDNRWIALVVGLLVVGLLAQVPMLGWLVSLVVTLLGLGTLAHLLWERRSTEASPPATA